MSPAARLPREASSLLLLCLLAFASVGVMAPAIRGAEAASSYSSMTYSGVIGVSWTGITADWDGNLDLSTKLTFTVNLNEAVGDGNLTGAATAQGSFTGTYSNSDPEYPAECPRQVSITGTYTYAIMGYTDFANGQVLFYASGPGNWTENDNPVPAPECWPGVSAGGIPETYSEWTIDNDLGMCFEQGQPCSQFPLDGGTTTVCSSTQLIGCDGTDEATLISSTTASQMTTISTTSVSTTNQTTCPSMSLTEGLAPAAPTTGDTNIYLNLAWGGQIPPDGLEVVFASTLGPAGTDFAFNPVTMMGPTLHVLMDVTTFHTPDGVYTVTVTATLTDPVSGLPCTADANVTFTVSGTTVFTTTVGQSTGSALWPPGITSPILITGNVTASQFSNVKPTLDENSHIVTIDFTLTGPAGTRGTATIAIPKTDLPPGTKPVLMENGLMVQNQVLTEDANSYFLTFTTQFSTHTFRVQLEQATQSASTTAQSSQNITSVATTSTTPASTGGGIPVIGIAAGSVVVFAALAAIILLRMRRRTHMEVGRGPARGAGEVLRVNYCRNCGKASEPNEEYCTNCGTSLRRAPTNPKTS